MEVVWKASKNASDEVILDSLLMLEKRGYYFLLKEKRGEGNRRKIKREKRTISFSNACYFPKEK